MFDCAVYLGYLVKLNLLGLTNSSFIIPFIIPSIHFFQKEKKKIMFLFPIGDLHGNLDDLLLIFYKVSRQSVM